MRSARRNIGERSANPSSLLAAGRPDDRRRMEMGGSGSTKCPFYSVRARFVLPLASYLESYCWVTRTVCDLRSRLHTEPKTERFARRVETRIRELRKSTVSSRIAV